MNLATLSRRDALLADLYHFTRAKDSAGLINALKRFVSDGAVEEVDLAECDLEVAWQTLGKKTG